jgi:hypothetical protein
MLLVGMPIYLTGLFSAKKGTDVTMFRQLNSGLTIGMSTYVSASALIAVEDRLISRFNNYDPEELDAYYNFLKSSPHLTLNQAMFWDLLNHTLITIGFMMSAMSIAGSSWYFVYRELMDDEM